jgi:hypothetical protein
VARTHRVRRVRTRLEFEGVPRYFLFGADGKLLLNTDKVDELGKKLGELFPKA